MRNILIATLLALLPLCSPAQTIKATLSTLRSIALPLLEIETEGRVNPTFKPIEAPQGCWGVGITDNDFVAGRLRITLLDSTLYDSGEYEKGESGMRIRVRGNTSALEKQTPYKLKLSKKADLLMRGNKKLKNKNWALLSTQKAGQLLYTFAGLEAARIVGMPWQPELEFVNVMLNGRYLGVYNLVETVERADARIKTDESGFVVENDAYWWNSGDAYFHTAHQMSEMGFTFKYPDEEEADSQRTAQIRDIMERAEGALYDTDEEVDSLFDYPTFQKWVLAHDLLGTTDAAGTNMFYVMESVDSAGNALTPLKAGPLWDFGAIFHSSDWSLQHTFGTTYYPQLFRRPKFTSEYVCRFDSLKSTFLPAIYEKFDSLYTKHGEAITQSALLSDSDNSEVETQISDILANFAERIEVVDSLIKRDYAAVTAIEVPTLQTGRGCTLVRRVDLSGRDFTHTDALALPRGIYIEQFSDGSVRKRMGGKK